MRKTMRIITFLLIATFMSLPSKHGSYAAALNQSSTSETQPEEPYSVYVLAPQNTLGQSLSSIVSKLGEPIKHSVEPSKNKHEKGRIDSIHTLSYDGLKVATYEVRKWEKEYLLSVEMNKNYPQVTKDLQIGMTVDELRKRVGQPTAEKKNEIEWTLSGEQGEYAVMTVSLKKGKVKKIVWLYFLD